MSLDQSQDRQVERATKAAPSATGKWAPRHSRGFGGEVWHNIEYSPTARCSALLRLEIARAETSPPSAARACAACRRCIDAAEKRLTKLRCDIPAPRSKPLGERLRDSGAHSRQLGASNRAKACEDGAAYVDQTAALLRELKPYLKLETPVTIMGRIDLQIAKAEGK